MGRGVYGAVMKLLRAQDFRCTVVGCWMHTPTMRAVRIYAPEFVEQVKPAEGEFLRCWFPLPKQPHKEAMRGYTIVDLAPEAGEFTLLFLLHEPAGPASEWAKNAAPGDAFVASYYGSSPFQLPTPEPRGFVFLADAAGIPYLNAVAAQIPAHLPVKAWLLQWHATDRQIPLLETPNLHAEWIEPNASALLARAKNFDWEGWYPHLICESQVLLPTRRYLLKEAGLAKHTMHVHAYWARGRAMGSERSSVN